MLPAFELQRGDVEVAAEAEQKSLEIRESVLSSNHMAFSTAKSAASDKPRSQAKYHMGSILSQ